MRNVLSASDWPINEKPCSDWSLPVLLALVLSSLHELLDQEKLLLQTILAMLETVDGVKSLGDLETKI